MTRLTARRLLSIADHDRDATGMTYVYPVLSRRAGGVSLGVNLNPNNACNFRCIYCQVPNLKWGKAPAVDIDRLRLELTELLDDLICGDFMTRRVPEGMRRLNDLAFSGNGEPTTCPNFEQVAAEVALILSRFTLPADFKIVLITNGTRTDAPSVERGLDVLARWPIEVWFKLDAATRAGTERINSSSASLAAREARLARIAARHPTWLQTCLFAIDGSAPEASEQQAYLALLQRLKSEGIPLRGVLLYGLSRPSLQAEAPRLSALSDDWFQDLAARIRAVGWAVRITP